jgi:hypothetical protein
MKKRIVNVLLSVAVVTTMMFTVTACGSKDDGKGAEPATVENTVSDAEPASEAKDEPASEAKDEPASEAKDEPAENADAAGGMSVSDWVNSDEASTYTSVFNTMFDGAMTATFEADGNTLSMVFTLSEETLGTDGSDLTDEQKEAAQTMMQEQYNASKGEFEPMRDELKKSIGVSDLVVRIVYKTSNGTELFSQDL